MLVKRLQIYVTAVALLVTGGCVTMPTGPTVMVLPAPGKPFEQFQVEDMNCRRWAEQQVGMAPQDVANQDTATGAVVGTAIGTGVGALLGAASGHAGTGAVVGAGTGLLVGTAAGANSGQVSGYEAQRRYDHAYVQCMYANGNQVPGQVWQHRRTRRLPPPPPGYNRVPPDYVPSDDD
ncbi:MAG TPA: glycine zipper family protein [Geobacteraceae bacterium]